MGLRNEKTTEIFDFTNLAELRDWLNRFKKTDLTCINAETCENNHIRISWTEEILSDGSVVNNARFS